MAADFNGDGVVDLVGGAGSELYTLMGIGDGTFQSAQTTTTTVGSYDITAADYNGDGFMDISTVTSSSGYFAVLLGDGSGSFSLGSTVTSALGTADLRDTAAADFNNDGVYDIAVADLDASVVSVFLAQTTSGTSPILDFSLETMAGARQSLPILQRKLDQLSEQRGVIGAFQSRLTTASRVLQASTENIRAAESRIRDADIAQETAELTRLSILQQASSAVLAQANQQPALALQLLS